MRKTVFYSAIFLVFLGFGYWFSSLSFFNGSGLSGVGASQSSRNGNGSPALIPIQKIAEADANQLHQYYFSSQIETEAASPLFWEKTQERFQKPLPKDRTKHQVAFVRELSTRLSILRSMGDWNQFPKEKYQFYLSLLEDSSQHWLVHREALHQIRPLLRLQGKEERDRILSLVPSRVRGLASQSTRELLLPLGEKR